MANKASSTADETIEIVCRGIGCNTGTGKYAPVKVLDGGRNTTLDDLVILASKAGPPFGWNWYRYIIMCTRKGLRLTGCSEDASKLRMTVAEVIEQHGPIKMIMLSGMMRGGAQTHLTGNTMLESIRMNEAKAAVAATAMTTATVTAAAKEEGGNDDTEKKSEAMLVGGVSFDDVDGDTSTLRVSTLSSSDGSSSDVLSWYAGGHCLIESVSSLKFDPDEMTLTCPQPILPTPFTNERVWNTLVAVLNPGDTNELLGRIRTMLSETMSEVALDGFP
jgi:hypothetical protein